jgi:O-antigen/teichoic acid export membrane protein
MADNLKQKTVSGVIWKFLEKFSVQGFMFIQSIIMARLLDPSDYGLVAMVAILNGISAIFIDSGFNNALIRKKDRTALDYSTVCVVNVVMALIMSLFLFLSAPFIASFYNQPILRNIVYLFAIQNIFGILVAVQGAKMTCELQFKKLSVITVVATICSGLFSIVLAYCGWGVYAIVIPGYLTILIRFGLYRYYQHWFPGFKFSKKSFNELFGYGSKILATNLINCIFNNIYPIVIGKKFSAADLGYYSRGQGYASLPSSTVTDVVYSVAFPVLSEIQDDKERLASSYRKMLRVSAFLVFPMMIVLAVLARPAVIVFISSKWEPCVIYLQILCFASMWSPVHSLNLALLQVKGRSDLFLRLEILKKIMIVLVLIVAIPFGIVYMCWGSVILSVVFLFINTFYTGKLLDLGLGQQMKDISPSLLLSLSVGIVVYVISSNIQSMISQLILGSSVAFIMYVYLARLLKMEEESFVWEVIKEKFRK